MLSVCRPPLLLTGVRQGFLILRGYFTASCADRTESRSERDTLLGLSVLTRLICQPLVAEWVENHRAAPPRCKPDRLLPASGTHVALIRKASSGLIS
ncbi:hypothetical protein J6590_013891 [Homalodisca vitripennis]|nr:hypothetical protein J6590_013891 [Homalodisca vitripennis]